MPPEYDEDGNLIEDPNLTPAPEDDEVPDPNDIATGADDDPPGDDDDPKLEELSLEDRLENELGVMRSDDDDPDDKDKDKDGVKATDGEPGDGEEKPAEGEGEATGEKKPVDGEQDPNADPDDALAADMKERTRERFNEIRDENKTLKGQIDNFQEGSQELHNVILESTATAQQLSGVLGIFKAVNSGDAAEAQKILPEIKLFYDAIAQTAGQPTLGGDVLEQFPDLQKAVKDLDISQDKAEELAGLRTQQVQNQQRVDTTNINDQQRGQHQVASQQAVVDIKGWEDGMLANDADYKLLQPKMVAESKAIMAQYHPSQWLQAMQAKYHDMHSGLALANKTQQHKSPQTLRPVNSGAKTKVDTSKLSLGDLMNNSLANMRG